MIFLSGSNGETAFDEKRPRQPQPQQLSFVFNEVKKTLEENLEGILAPKKKKKKKKKDRRRGRRSMFDEELDKYNTYEEYLDSLVSEEDHRFLEDEEMARQIAELGYR